MGTAVLQRYGLTDVKNNFSAYTAEANRTGMPFIVEKQDKPWVKIVPLQRQKDDGSIIVPIRKQVEVADIEQLFAASASDYIPTEDGFAQSFGQEAL